MSLRERGNALIMMVIIVPVLIGIAGLALDWGRGVWTQVKMQKASDAAALAGASELPDQTSAWDIASVYVNSNYPDADDVVLTPSSGTFKVEITDTINTFFMSLFGHDTMEVFVDSTATIKQPVGGLRGGGFPFAIINPDLNGDPVDDLVPANYGREYVIMYGEDNLFVPDWANGSAPMGETDSNSSGWRGALKLNMDGTMDGEAGADDLVYNFINGWPGTAIIGDDLLVQTGNIDNPVNKARDDLLGPDPVAWEDFDPEIHANSTRVVMVPIVHLVNVSRQDTYTIQDYNNGVAYEHDFVVLDGFAPFFIETVTEQGDVDGDGTTGDRDWIVARFIPGVETRNFAPPAQGVPNYGLYSPPRLVE